MLAARPEPWHRHGCVLPVTQFLRSGHYQFSIRKRSGGYHTHASAEGRYKRRSLSDTDKHSYRLHGYRTFLAAQAASTPQSRAAELVAAPDEPWALALGLGDADVEQLSTVHSSEATARDEYTLGTVYSM